MKIFIVETRPEDRPTNVWAIRRAVVVATGEEAAVGVVERARAGKEVFSGFKDEERFARGDNPAFNAETALVYEIGIAENDGKGSRILAWELYVPEPDSSTADDFLSEM